MSKQLILNRLLHYKNIDNHDNINNNISDQHKNYETIESKTNEKITTLNKLDIIKKVLFINFKPDNTKAYGGGNISTYYLQNFFGHEYSNFKITHELNTNQHIDLYFVIDPFKDKYHKPFGLSDIIIHRKKYNKNSKIVYRANDCDATRPTLTSERSREKIIVNEINNIDAIIFNSKFIRDYYFSKYEIMKSVKNHIIHNGADENIFYGNPNLGSLKNNDKNKINIVTHHWSNNMFKGYQIYYDLWKYCQSSDVFNFIFIGKNVPDMFKEVPILGPYSSLEVANKLRECHIYISDSKLESCPNHIIEAIMTELPILYTSSEGGGKELCTLTNNKIGEDFSNFDELISKLHKIFQNYGEYKNSVAKVKNYFKIENCGHAYNSAFTDLIYPKCVYKTSAYLNGRTIIKFNLKSDQLLRAYIKINNKKKCYAGIGESAIMVDENENVTIEIFSDTDNFTVENFYTYPFRDIKSKLSNEKDLNILYCSDSDYFVGMFAGFQSVIKNLEDKNSLEEIQFNFIIPTRNSEHFNNMLTAFMCETKLSLCVTVVYVCDDIIPDEIKKSKCTGGGKHLLNIGNFSRMLIGELFLYDKLLYLDADSIVQSDVYKKLRDFKLQYPLYTNCANKENIDSGQHIVLKLKNILNAEYTKWREIIGIDINLENYVYMGSPFLADCTQWTNVYNKMIELVCEHNKLENGLYRLFTMSLMNILFYGNIGNIEEVMTALPDLGSKRKKWSADILDKTDVLDWSGVFKPWFGNGLYKNKWVQYDLLKLSEKYQNVIADESLKNKSESYKTSNVTHENYKNFDFTYKSLVSDKFNKFPNFDEINTYVHNEMKIGCPEYYSYVLLGNDSHINKNLLEQSKGTFNLMCLIDATHLITKMSRVRFWTYENLIRRDNINFIYFGPSWMGWNSELSLQANVLKFLQNTRIKLDFIEWYKPLDYNFDNTVELPCPTCIRYNEMWDEEWTRKEIDVSGSNLVICHHKNDFEKYKAIYSEQPFVSNKNVKFVYIPHHANPDIFYATGETKKIDILLSGITKEKHYPLRYRLHNLIINNRNTVLKNYNVHVHNHPGYSTNSAFKSTSQKAYNELINKSKICMSCTSKHNYRLGKYVEISMAGSIICGDVPYEDQDNFRKFMIEANMSMIDEEILNSIVYHLENTEILKNKSELATKWSEDFTTQKYSDSLYSSMIEYKNYKKKIYIISDEIKPNHPEFGNKKWICDILKEEFMAYYPEHSTINAKDADIIWYLAPWNHRHIPSGFNVRSWDTFLKTKSVIATLHHIDPTKLSEHAKMFEFMDKYVNKYHAICELTYQTLLNLNKKVTKEFLWINDNVFTNLQYKKFNLRRKYKFSLDVFLVGSFQKDTEGKSNEPKLSKGPDIFINICKNMKRSKPNIEVVLTGVRRKYVTDKLDEIGIRYHYFNMVSLETINELFNCLDLYIVSSRCEGGPRSIFEAGITGTPIISTDVGIATDIMPKESIYDMNKFKTYKNANPNPEKLYENVSKLKIDSQIPNILKMLLD